MVIQYWETPSGGKYIRGDPTRNSGKTTKVTNSVFQSIAKDPKNEWIRTFNTKNQKTRGSSYFTTSRLNKENEKAKAGNKDNEFWNEYARYIRKHKSKEKVPTSRSLEDLLEQRLREAVAAKAAKDEWKKRDTILQLRRLLDSSVKSAKGKSAPLSSAKRKAALDFLLKEDSKDSLVKARKLLAKRKKARDIEAAKTKNLRKSKRKRKPKKLGRPDKETSSEQLAHLKTLRDEHLRKKLEEAVKWAQETNFEKFSKSSKKTKEQHCLKLMRKLMVLAKDYKSLEKRSNARFNAYIDGFDKLKKMNPPCTFEEGSPEAMEFRMLGLLPIQISGIHEKHIKDPKELVTKPTNECLKLLHKILKNYKEWQEAEDARKVVGDTMKWVNRSINACFVVKSWSHVKDVVRGKPKSGKSRSKSGKSKSKSKSRSKSSGSGGAALNRNRNKKSRKQDQGGPSVW